MFGDRSRPSQKSVWSVLLALFAIALVMLGTTASVAHGHAPGQPGQDLHEGCSLCLTTHAAVAVALVLTLAIQQQATRLRPRRVRTGISRRAECPYWNRPPPARRSFS